MSAMRWGVNYPWRQYGGDFGRSVWGRADGVAQHSRAIAGDFAAMAAAGVEIVRWFVFTDGRGGLDIDGAGWPAGIQAAAWTDLDTLFTLALDARLTLVPVLFDHTLAFDGHDAAGARLGGRAVWLADPDGQARLLDAVVTPLARRYGARGARADLGRAVYAWDLFNEPDWIVDELHPASRVTTPIPFDVMAAWACAATAVLRRHDAGRVTLGNARVRFARWWDAPAFDFDFLQVHAYYDPSHDFDLLATSPASLGITRPVVVGECSAGGDAEDRDRGRPALPFAALSAAAARRGYAGAWPWSWRGVDGHGAPPDGAFRSLRDAWAAERDPRR